MLTRLLAITLPGFAAGAVMMALGSRRVEPAVRRARWIKFVVYLAVVHLVLGAAAAGRWWIRSMVFLVLSAATFELERATRRLRFRARVVVWGVFLPAGLLFYLQASSLPPATIAALYVVVAVYDGFSQVSGQLFGRRPLAPRISPGKTVEGLAGGLAGSVLVALILRDAFGVGFAAAGAVGIGVGLTGLAGDLAASWVKRASGIKDYSNLLPGHGGVLDRFDSFIAAGAIVGTFL